MLISDDGPGFSDVSHELIPSDSNTSTLKADTTFHVEYSSHLGEATSLETLGYYDDIWNGKYEMLYEWIDGMDFVKTQKNVNRDFSSGVLMAELLKKLWPKLVDLHNYSPANSFNNKLANWKTLNKKVLRRVKLEQSDKTLEDLAKAEPGVLETLLSKVKLKYDNSKIPPPPPESINSEDLSINALVVNGQKINKDQFTTIVTKCDLLQEELSESDEVIKILKNKVTHLEELLETRDEIIRKLKTELNLYKTVTPTDVMGTLSELANLCRSPDQCTGAGQSNQGHSTGQSSSSSSSVSNADAMNNCKCMD
uniref:Sperm flagellar protein 1 n=1 Tax=Cacopsylla melanoneura TaxID=428564 RepID=A0A8D9AXI7_9HEMI